MHRYNLYSLLFVLCQFFSSMLDKKMMLCKEVKHGIKYLWSLKYIGDELWCCHGDGITVNSFDLKIPANLSYKYGAKSAASLDVKTVVIATRDGLSTCSKQGL